MRTVLLGEVAKVVSGATPKTGVPEYWDGDVAWVTPADLSRLPGPYIEHTPRTLTQTGLKSCAASELPMNSVLLSSRAPIGHVAINKIPMATNQGFKSLVPGPTLDAKYLYHWLKSETDYLQSLGNGATFKEISKRVVESVEIPLPTLTAQRRIAAILDQADALRAKRRQVVAYLDALTQSIFHDMFGDQDLEPVPAKSLITSFRNGLSPSTDGAYPANVLTLSAVTRGRFDPSFTKPGSFAMVPPAEKRVASGDFLICRGNGNKSLVGVGTFSAVDRPDLVFPDTVIAAKVNRSLITMNFLDTIWGLPHVRRQIEAGARTTNGTHKINQQLLSSVTLPLAPIERQRDFDKRVAEVDRHSQMVQEALKSSDELLESLPYRAFRGEL